ncbi:MAG: leucine-rich repeat domain-containing protein, partial [Bacteroidales bacterium]|nr:leucine-rich repeat domain-containing protein [Bacteroidales bacterium]
TVAMLALSISMTATSCHKDDDNKPADNAKTENTTPTPDDKTPVVEKVTITFSDGTSKELQKGAKYTLPLESVTDDGLTVRYYINGEDVSGKEITVLANTEVVIKEIANLLFSDGSIKEFEKGTEYTLPSGEKEYIIYKIGDEQFGSGDKISVDKSMVISIVAKYPELTMEELKSSDFSDKDEVFLRITDVTDENVGNIKGYLTTKTNLIIAGEVTTIGFQAFQECTSLQSIVIPNSVTDINWSAFDNCSSLQSFTIPNSVESIGAYAFCYCTSLQSIEIPNSVETIGINAFSDCTSLQSIVIKNSEKNVTIGEDAFLHCPGTPVYESK